VCFAEGACAAVDERKEEAFEEGGWFVERFLEGVVEVDVELFSPVDIFPDSVEDDCF